MSGYGNVGWGIMKKIAELGGKVTYFAGPDGYIHDPDGVVTEEKLNYILEMRAKDPMHCKPYADKFGVEFVEGQKCWGVKDVDVYMPAATQNDVNMEWAEKIAASGVPYYIEVGNMPTTNDALAFLMQPSKRLFYFLNNHLLLMFFHIVIVEFKGDFLGFGFAI